jgi:hypothetical protein
MGEEQTEPEAQPDTIAEEETKQADAVPKAKPKKTTKAKKGKKSTKAKKKKKSTKTKKKTTKAKKSTKGKKKTKKSKKAPKPSKDKEASAPADSAEESAEPTEPAGPEVKEVITIGAEFAEETLTDEERATLEDSQKWWLKEPYRSLLDPDLVKNVDMKSFDLSSLIEDFTDRMIAEEYIDFRISGMAIYSSAKFYHQKITGVIRQEEEIQKKEMRERLRRDIPRAIAQPIREARKIATAEELFGAMRRAIIGTMQKREKLRIRRERMVAKREKRVLRRSKGRLPAEILKHITGKEETIEVRLRRRHRQIMEIISLEDAEDNTMSMAQFKKMIYNQEKHSTFEKKVKYIDAFEELLFLASLNKIHLNQRTMRTSIGIKLVDTSKIEF